MKGYAFIEKDTNVVSYICSWGDMDIDGDYPVEECNYVLELQEEDYRRFEEIVLANKGIKIIDIENLIIEEFIEEVVKIPTETEILQERLDKAEQESLNTLEIITSLYEQILTLQENLNGGA